MSIVKMSKFKLMGLTYHKESILNALHKTASLEISETEEFADTFCVVDNEKREGLQQKLIKANNVVEFYIDQLSKAVDKPYYPKKAKEYLTNFFVSYDEFINVNQQEKLINAFIEEGLSFEKDISELRSMKIKFQNQITQLEPYSSLSKPFSAYSDTANVKIILGTVKRENLTLFDALKAENQLFDYELLNENANSIIAVYCYKSVFETVNKSIMEYGFQKCPFEFDIKASEEINRLKNEISVIDSKIESVSELVCKKSCNLKSIKILADYYSFLLEKQVDSEKFRCTEKTFLLEGYVPEENKEDVRKAVLEVTDAVFMDFSEPTKDDNPPTLTRNNKVVRQAEFVTDMYSVPNYSEMDPSKVVFFFFMLFMGVIMADIGYGIMMVVIGFILASKIKVDNGTRRLWNIIAIGGIFTVIFGVLFNSCFGVALPFLKAVLPNPVPTSGGGTDGLMTILLGCLGLGVIQIATGYFCKAINCFKQNDIAGGLFDGLIWVLFFIGLVIFATPVLLDMLMGGAEKVLPENIYNVLDTLKTPSLILLIGSVAIAAITAGRNEKGFGKFTKGFGQVYGLINIMSDILSYARLFGLMLSGMIIAQTFNDMGTSMMNGNFALYILGGLIIVVGHVFNIAMNVLGAYIHDCRLQYIEFFGKFYTGEGEKFTPFGSRFKYIYLKNK